MAPSTLPVCVYPTEQLCRSSTSLPYKMDTISLVLPLVPTIPFSLNSTPFPPSTNIIPAPSLLNSTTQYTIMSGVARNNRAGAGARPPRPPNAWILYRSDKFQELPPPPPGQPKPTQAEISKMIAAQWRNESDEVRAIYEQRAEMAKAEHARMYPHYRFAPMKKADRERIREEKRQAKEQERANRRTRGRVAPYPTPSTASYLASTTPLVINQVVPNVRYTPTPISSASSSSSSSSSMTPPAQSCVGVAPSLDWTRVSPDASADYSHFPPIDSQIPSLRDPSHLLNIVSSVAPSPVVSPKPRFVSPQPPPEFRLPRGWESSGEDLPFEDILKACACAYSFLSRILTRTSQNYSIVAMPFYDKIPMPDMRTLAQKRGVRPTVSELQALANENVVAPSSIDVGLGVHPSPMYGSASYHDSLRLLGEESETFMSEPTVEQLLATINKLVESDSQENAPSLSSNTAPTDSIPGFNFDDFVEDFGISTVQGLDGMPTTWSRPEGQSLAVDPSLPYDSLATFGSHSENVVHPAPSFYVTTPSPTSTGSTPLPPAHNPYVPPRGAANSSIRRVGGNWKVPVAISRLASPLPS